MHITIKFFAILRDLAGQPEMSREISSGSTVAEITNHLRQQIPALNRSTTKIACAVNEQFVPPDTQLRDGDVLALIPPVSGG